jgi:hypothetical protein
MARRSVSRGTISFSLIPNACQSNPYVRTRLKPLQPQGPSRSNALNQP